MTETLTIKRPETLEGRTHKIDTPCGSLYLTLNENDSKLYEIRISLGKIGNCARTLLQTIAVLFSVLLQSDIPRSKILKTLENGFDANCANPFYLDGTHYKSCIDLICKTMGEDLLNRGEIALEEET